MEKINADLVYFRSSDGLELQGALKRGKKRSNKLIIHVHGMTGDFCRGSFTRILFGSFINTGYDFFSINTRGAGVINKFYGKKKKYVIGTARENVEDCIYDIDGAIRAGKKMGYKKFILCGHSTGCQKVAYYQGKKKNRLVESVILLSPCDDYNVTRLELGNKKFNNYVRRATKLLKEGKGNDKFEIPGNEYSAKRWLSFTDKKRVEAQLFNYDGRMHFFSKIKVPMLAVFGSKDYFADHDAKESLDILGKKTKSELLATAIVKGADHCYKGKEKELVKVVRRFIRLF